MSVQTIKGSRQKSADGNSYGRYIPFGADGEYVDMLSGLTLERQLKLGGDHITTISTNQQGQTVITQKYADSESLNSFYNVVTTIGKSGNATVITSQLHWIDNQGNDTLKNTKTITIGGSGGQTEIEEVLS